ncbi:MAG: 3'(2'),5'-bisphosphate nucleotidase CysQ [Alphaproteobacteria bacterium]|nr:3'(2'),5'-bisphosphate nucleotidase CysQ [Alphaproteobacteria bacterium]
MVRRIAIDAGVIILKYFEMGENLTVDTKHDNSPVTLADRDAENFIQMSLESLLPDVPMVGEEAAALGRLPDLSNSEYFWLVDPLDGTKSFINGHDNFTVNIALIKNHEPVLGIVYAPALGDMFAGHGIGTSVHWREDTDKEKPITVRPPPKKGLTVVASANHGNNDKLEKFLEEFKVEKILKHSSSLKICAIAEGKADIYPRLGPTSEWDTAAGDAILRSAGGMITDIKGNPLRYGGFRPKFLNPEFVACSFKWFDFEDN